MSQGTPRTWIAALLMGALLVGCKAAPAPSVGFADPSLMKNDPAIPFDRFWRKPGVDWKSYDKIYIADVNTSYMLKMTVWEKGERQGDLEHDVQVVAAHMRSSLANAFAKDPNHRFQVLDHPIQEPRTLTLEVALIEVVPSKVLLNALGYAPFYIGTGITVVRTLANDKSSAAFEARIRDAQAGKVLMLAADREAEQYAPVDLRGLTWYSDVDGIIDDWSQQFVQIMDKKPGEKVNGSPTFRLLPW